MRTINVDTLIPGTISDGEYCGPEGELLIAKGVVITECHLDLLKRRRVYEVYLKDDESELNRILNTNLKNIEELQFDSKKEFPLPSLFKEFGTIEKGEKGFKQLLDNKITSNLDHALQFGRISDQPIGKSMRSSIRQIFTSKRPFQYKQEISFTYGQALTETKTVLDHLAGGKKIDGETIRRIVESLLKTFLIDHNVLLAMSTQKPDSEDHLYHHSLNVCLLAMNIATAAGYGEEQVVQIGMGALLHDVGMFLIPKEIRFKPGRLTDDEWFEIRKHPLLGLHLLEKLVHLPDSVKFTVYQVHERDNGTGYPKQRSVKLIHSFAKIVQIADIFEAISSPRFYRCAYAPYKGMEMLIKMTRKGLISGEFVKAFLSFASLFPVGSYVQLNDLRMGKVIAAHETRFTKPIISILVDGEGIALNQDQVYQVDLSKEVDFQVIRSLPQDFFKFDILHGF